MEHCSIRRPYKLIKTYLIGVYDNSLKFKKELESVFNAEDILLYQVLKRDESEKLNKNKVIKIHSDKLRADIVENLVTKSRFFDLSQHILIRIDNMESLSFLTTAIVNLIKSKILSLTIITKREPSFIFQAGDVEEQLKIQELKSEGRLIIQYTFSAEKYRKIIKQISNAMPT